MSDITLFKGKYWFLSNFSPSTVVFEGISFKTVEHAFQAAKTFERAPRLEIRTTPHPRVAKELGRKVNLRPDWEQVKDQIMLDLLRFKFSWLYHPKLALKLLSTGTQGLKEGNGWGDTYWGVDEYTLEGNNVLGKLLMQVRDEVMLAEPIYRRYERVG